MNLTNLLTSIFNKKEDLREYLDGNSKDKYSVDGYTTYQFEQMTVLYNEEKDCVEEVTLGVRR